VSGARPDSVNRSGVPAASETATVSCVQTPRAVPQAIRTLPDWSGEWTLATIDVAVAVAVGAPAYGVFGPPKVALSVQPSDSPVAVNRPSRPCAVRLTSIIFAVPLVFVTPSSQA
jgi:hypothetical protein